MPFRRDVALRKKLPLTERAYPVVSKLDASGRYELWLDYVLTLTAQFAKPRLARS